MRKAGVQVSLQEPLEAGGQLTLADTLPDDAEMEATTASSGPTLPGCAGWWTPCRPERAVMRMRYGFGGGPCAAAADGASAGYQPQLCIAPPLIKRCPEGRKLPGISALIINFSGHSSNY